MITQHCIDCDSENIIEINQLTEDAIEDAVLMGVDPDQVLSVLLKALKQKHR